MTNWEGAANNVLQLEIMLYFVMVEWITLLLLILEIPAQPGGVSLFFVSPSRKMPR
jgi:hypothetical protein